MLAFGWVKAWGLEKRSPEELLAEVSGHAKVIATIALPSTFNATLALVPRHTCLLSPLRVQWGAVEAR